MKKRNKLFAAVAAMFSLVSLSACDDLMGTGDDCHVDSDYRIWCDIDDGPTLHEPNQ